MQLPILGATGATGTCLTQQALTAGHEVTAVVRDPARLAVPAHQRLRILTPDVMAPASTTPPIAGAAAATSAVAPPATAPPTVIHDSVRSTAQATLTPGASPLIDA